MPIARHAYRALTLSSPPRGSHAHLAIIPSQAINAEQWRCSTTATETKDSEGLESHEVPTEAKASRDTEREESNMKFKFHVLSQRYDHAKDKSVPGLRNMRASAQHLQRKEGTQPLVRGLVAKKRAAKRSDPKPIVRKVDMEAVVRKLQTGTIVKKLETEALVRKHESGPIVKTHVTKDVQSRTVTSQRKQIQGYYQRQLHLSKASEATAALKDYPSSGDAASTDPTPDGKNVNYEIRQHLVAKNRFYKNKAANEPAFRWHSVSDMKIIPTELDFEPFLDDDFYPVLQLLFENTPGSTHQSIDELDVDRAYWESVESFQDEEVGGVVLDVLDDITYAPRADALRVRRQMAADPPTDIRETGLAFVPRPEKWTQWTFQDYLRRILVSARQAQEDHYDPSQMNAAEREIVQLLKDERFLPFIDNSILNIAIEHLSWRNQYEEVCSIYHHLHDHSFEFNSLDFSQLLFAAAHGEQTLTHFRPILKHMIECGFKPTGHTWFTFYQLISRRYPWRRPKVLGTMKVKGLLEVGETVKEALTTSLGWIEKSELVPKPAVRENGSGEGVDGGQEEIDALSPLRAR